MPKTSPLRFQLSQPYVATARIGDEASIHNMTPNVSFDAGAGFSGSPSVLTAYIRGIGSSDFSFNIDPGAGVHLDDVYLARAVGANEDLLDVDRIEVLKGPQGTLSEAGLERRRLVRAIQQAKALIESEASSF